MNGYLYKVVANDQLFIYLFINFLLIKTSKYIFYEIWHFSNSPTKIFFLYFSFLGYLLLKGIYIVDIFQIFKKLFFYF